MTPPALHLRASTRTHPRRTHLGGDSGESSALPPRCSEGLETAAADPRPATSPESEKSD